MKQAVSQSLAKHITVLSRSIKKLQAIDPLTPEIREKKDSLLKDYKSRRGSAMDKLRRVRDGEKNIF